MWTLKYNDTEKSFEDWGISNVRRSLASQDEDKLTFDAKASFLAEPLFSFGDSVTIYRGRASDGNGGFSGGTQWFVGVLVKTPRAAQGKSQAVSYEFSGPWWYLNNRVFQRAAKTYTGDPENLTTVYLSHLWLGQGVTGARLNTGEEITNIIAFAGAQGDPIQLNVTGLPAVNAPVNEARDITCAEAIRQLLRWSPDAVTWFDYATSPPTLHVRRRADLGTLAVAVPGPPQISLTPRPDLQLPGVFLTFESTNTVDGQSWLEVTTQKYPAEATGLELRALRSTIDLQGFSASYATAEIECAPVNSHVGGDDDAARIAWWKQFIPDLDDERIYELRIYSEDFPRETSLPRYLVAGQIAGWMDVSAQEETIQAYVSYFTKGGDDQDPENDPWTSYRLVTVRLVTTNATTGSYSQLMSAEDGESAPENLARDLYDAVSVLQYDGTLELAEQDVGGAQILGRCLNLTGARAEWAMMNALVQSVQEDVDTGRTTITVGPPAHLGPDDLVELLRANRTRRIYQAPGTALDAESRGGGRVGLGSHTARENSIAGRERLDSIFIGSEGSSIRLKPKAGKEVELRELQFKDAADCTKTYKVWVVMSAPELVT